MRQFKTAVLIHTEIMQFYWGRIRRDKSSWREAGRDSLPVCHQTLLDIKTSDILNNSSFTQPFTHCLNHIILINQNQSINILNNRLEAHAQQHDTIQLKTMKIKKNTAPMRTQNQVLLYKLTADRWVTLSWQVLQVVWPLTRVRYDSKEL